MKSKSVIQFCTDHGISRVTFYSEVRLGRLRIFKAGRWTRVSSDAEKDYIEQAEQRAILEAPDASRRARAMAAKRNPVA